MDKLILGMPNKIVVKEIQLIRSKSIDVILTKESGQSGSLSIKIEAALTLDIQIFIIKRPSLPNTFITFNNDYEIINHLQNHHSKLIIGD